MAPLVVLIGISGSGKSTVGAAVARELRVPFQEGDLLHSASSIATMRAGRPLDDAARGPWLVRIGQWLEGRLARREGGVISCSALRRSARDHLRRPGVTLVWLDVPRTELDRRVRHRVHAFMPASLLDSQVDTFEPPAEQESVIRIDASDALETTVARVLASLVD